MLTYLGEDITREGLEKKLHSEFEKPWSLCAVDTKKTQKRL